MGLPDHYLAIDARDAAPAGRARGENRRFAAMIADAARRHSASHGMESATARAGGQIAAQLGEIQTAGRERADEVRREGAQAARSGYAAQAHARQKIVDTLERVGVLSTAWKNSLPDPHTLFETWLALQHCKKLTTDLAIDDTKLVRKVAVSCAVIERYAAGLRLVPFNGILREMADVVDGLHTCFLLQMSFTINDRAVADGDPLYPGQYKICPSLTLAFQGGLGDLDALRARCTALRPRLAALAEFGLLVAGSTGLERFSAEFSALDGPCAPPADERLAALAARYRLSFDHADPQSPITMMARVVLADRGVDELIEHCRQLLRDSHSSLLLEKHRQIEVLRTSPAIPVGWNAIRDATHYFIDLHQSLNSMGFLAQFGFPRILQGCFYLTGAIASLPFIKALVFVSGSSEVGGFGSTFSSFAIASAFIAGGEYLRAGRIQARKDLETELAGVERDMAAVAKGIRSG